MTLFMFKGEIGVDQSENGQQEDNDIEVRILKACERHDQDPNQGQGPQRVHHDHDELIHNKSP